VVSKLARILLIVLAGALILPATGARAAASSGQSNSNSSDTGQESPNKDPTDPYWYDESD